MAFVELWISCTSSSKLMWNEQCRYVDSTHRSRYQVFTNVALFLWSYILSIHVGFPIALDHYAPVDKMACEPVGVN